MSDAAGGTLRECGSGRLYGVGVGPGDPELLTLKAARVIGAAQVVAYPSARHGRSIARATAASCLRPDHIELPMVFPATVELPANTEDYGRTLTAWYDEMADTIAGHLSAGRDVAVLCEGDAFFYGSFMYLYERLAGRFPTEVVPGVTSITAAAARTGAPLARHDEVLVVVPGTLPYAELVARLRSADAAAVVKLGRNFSKVRDALAAAGLLERARYVERATMAAERLLPLASVDPETVPYFSLVFVPGEDSAPASSRRQAVTASADPPSLREARHNGVSHSSAPDSVGQLAVVGLGPGGDDWVSPEARAAVTVASDLVGYGPYLDRVLERSGQRRHASDNRAEAERARQALTLAAEGRQVAVISSGDPGIFAMATAVMEELETGPPIWRTVDVRVVPGISAMQAAAARAGAPLGHDFCVISLSDRLKSWEVVAQRLAAAAAADFAIALYNPASMQRTWQLAEAKAVLLRYRAPGTPVVVARALGSTSERVSVVDLGALDPATVDMRTILLVGASTTRRFQLAGGRGVVYTPRHYQSRPGASGASAEPVAAVASAGSGAPAWDGS